MNLPNQLTMARLGLTAVFVALISIDFAWSQRLALLTFIIASATDFLDGYLARKHNLITDFGKLMDPLVDKILTAAAFIGLVAVGMAPAWAVIVIIAREFMVTGLRLIATAKARVLPAEKLGKYKTISQMAYVIYVLLILALVEGGVLGAEQPVLLMIGTGLLWLAVLLTAWSGGSYLLKNRDLIEDC